MKRGTFQLMKSVNKSIILNEIRLHAPISRAQIAKNTKLTPPTVSSIVKELIEESIVIEKEVGESYGGRKPILLHINPDVFSIIGIDAGPRQIVGVVSNVNGEILNRYHVEVSQPLTNEHFLSLLKECIYELLKADEYIVGEVLGIGIAMHGVVDIEKGVSIVTPNLGLENIPIKESLEEEFDLEVMVENDARLMALGEAWFGGHGEIPSMIALNIGRGVGSGLIVDGKLYHGAQGIAGEVGHMTIDIHGQQCECGNRGCLETLATGNAIVKRAQEKTDNGTAHNVKLTAESVYELAKGGNEIFIETLEEVGEIIGVGVTNLIHIINPDKIVLGGGVMNSADFIYPKIIETVRERGITKDAKEAEIVISELGKDATLLGAVSQFVSNLFE